MLMEMYERFKSGEMCTESGCYEFDGYVDGSSECLPDPEEMEIELQMGEVFPSFPPERNCFWAPNDGLLKEVSGAFQVALV